MFADEPRSTRTQHGLFATAFAFIREVSEIEDIVQYFILLDCPLLFTHLKVTSFLVPSIHFKSKDTAMHLILTGATGLVGAAVLDNMLAQQSISRISILSRRPVAMVEGHDKAKVIIHNDFGVYSEALLDELRDAKGCVWALGVSQNDVDKE
jgi:hypothetical protein